MLIPEDVHPTLDIDESVDQVGESDQHWAAKAAVVSYINSIPGCNGSIETEKKTGELIADIRCDLSEAPPELPQKFVVEIETEYSNKDRLRATRHHLRFGYAIFWVFLSSAIEERISAEETLSERSSEPPSFGIISLEDGELSLGRPICWDTYDLPTSLTGWNELKRPTYHRSAEWYNHGDFVVSTGEKITLYGGGDRLFMSRYLDEQQQTLPAKPTMTLAEFYDSLRAGDAKRVSPVRGPP